MFLNTMSSIYAHISLTDFRQGRGDFIAPIFY